MRIILNEEKDNENRMLPDIFEYLENIKNKQSVSVKGLDEIIDKVAINTAMSRESAEVVVELFFKEIRKELLKGNEITFRTLGNLFISCPKNSNNKTRVFPKFEPSDILVEDLNYEPEEE